MIPKYQIRQWVRFYQNGTLVIGVIQYIHETLYGYEYSTDVGAVLEKKKTSRRQDDLHQNHPHQAGVLCLEISTQFTNTASHYSKSK